MSEHDQDALKEALETALSTDIALTIRTHGLTDARTVQSNAGIIGPSDLGFCRQKAVLMVKGVPQSDSKSTWPAQVGTAVHNYVGDALRAMHPDWIVDGRKVTAKFPSGYEVTGTPDLMCAFTITLDGEDVTAFLVPDVKTVDGTADAKRNGPSMNHRFQRIAYALGAKQAGLIPEGMPLWVGNIYLDRSGKDAEPVVKLEPFTHAEVMEVDNWISDVVYAAVHNEDASRDVVPVICKAICEFFTVCRGGELPVSSNEVIDSDEVRGWVAMHQEGHALESRGKKMKKQAADLLSGMTGIVILDGDGAYQVRTTEVAETFTEGFMRRAYKRVDVSRMKGQ